MNCLASRAGATVYIPRDVTIGLVNMDAEPLGLAFVFSRPGFEELMRDNSVREGELVTLLSATERAAGTGDDQASCALRTRFKRDDPRWTRWVSRVTVALDRSALGRPAPAWPRLRGRGPHASGADGARGGVRGHAT